MHVRIGLVEDPPLNFKLDACQSGALYDGVFFGDDQILLDQCTSRNNNRNNTHEPHLVWKGAIIDLIELAAKVMNFTYDYVHSEDNLYGNAKMSQQGVPATAGPVNSNNVTAATQQHVYRYQWNGMLGMLASNTIDVAGGMLTMTKQRQADFDFVSVHTDIDEIVISKDYMRLEASAGGSGSFVQSVFDWFDFSFVFSPFSMLTWLAIMVACVVCIFLLLLTDGLVNRLHIRYSEAEQRNIVQAARRALTGEVNDEQQTLTASGNCAASEPLPMIISYSYYRSGVLACENVIGSLVSRSAEFLPSSMPARVMLLAWALTCTIIGSLYAAELTSQAIRPTSFVPFKDFVSMRDAGYRLLALRGGWAIPSLEELADNEQKNGSFAEAEAILQLIKEPFSGWPRTTSDIYQALRDNKYTGVRGLGDDGSGNSLYARRPQTPVKIEGPFAAYVKELDRYIFQSPNSCDLLRIPVPHLIKNSGTGFVFRKDDNSRKIRDVFHRAVMMIRDLGLDRNIFGHRLNYWSRVALNTSIASDLVCGGAPSESDRATSRADKRKEQLLINKDDNNLKFSSIRSVFSLLILGSLTGLTFLGVELGCYFRRQAKTGKRIVR